MAAEPTNQPSPRPLAPTDHQSPDAGSTMGLDPKIAAGLSCLAFLVSGIVFLALEKKNQYVRFWALQSSLLGAAILAVYIVLNIFSALFGRIWGLGLLVGLLVFLLSLAVFLGTGVLWVLCLVNAFSGKEWEIPYLGKLTREYLPKIQI